MNPSERQNKIRKERIPYSTSVADLVDMAEGFIKQYPHLTLDTIDIDTDEEWDSHFAVLEFITPETDSEMKYRLDWQKNVEASRRRQYEALKKEFEGGSKA